LCEPLRPARLPKLLALHAGACFPKKRKSANRLVRAPMNLVNSYQAGGVSRQPE
jgi:hypothetical protein